MLLGHATEDVRVGTGVSGLPEMVEPLRNVPVATGAVEQRTIGAAFGSSFQTATIETDVPTVAVVADDDDPLTVRLIGVACAVSCPVRNTPKPRSSAARAILRSVRIVSASHEGWPPIPRERRSRA